jgi:hypothetical protein
VLLPCSHPEVLFRKKHPRVLGTSTLECFI